MEDIKKPSFSEAQKPAPKTVISMQDVGVRYGSGDEILSDVTFHIQERSFYFLTGTSGAGKTTLMRLIYQLHKPCRGRIRLFGKNAHDLSRDGLADMRRRIGIVFQDYCLIDSLSVFDNIALPLRIMGESPDRISRLVKRVLAWVGLSAYARVKPMTLSGGQQQKIAVARAIITQPDILLADEPTGNLDDENSKKLMELFLELNKSGTTVIIATHSQKLLETYQYPRIYIDQKHVTFKKPFGMELGDTGTCATPTAKIESPGPLNLDDKKPTAPIDMKDYFSELYNNLQKQYDSFQSMVKPLNPDNKE